MSLVSKLTYFHGHCVNMSYNNIDNQFGEEVAKIIGEFLISESSSDLNFLELSGT